MATRPASDRRKSRSSTNSTPRPSSSWQKSLGVSSNVSALNLGSFLLHSTCSILFLVFLNATQPFLISQLGETKRQGTLSGTLVFSDELLSMFLVLFWGSLADITGTKLVAVSGYCFIAIALFAFTWAQAPWPDLLFCRLAFAVGGSAVTSMLSGEWSYGKYG
jgi:MFS family permease